MEYSQIIFQIVTQQELQKLVNNLVKKVDFKDINFQ